jgi:hypothetical protein
LEKMTGYCGYNCGRCAARSDDPAVRQKLVDGWKKLFGHEHYTAENVRCDGCRADGRLADKSCQVRPCAKEKGIASCGLCAGFPCKSVRPLMGSREGMLLHCYPRTADVTEEEYDLCMRQFAGMESLIRIMVDNGRLPAWMAEKHDV